MTDTEIILKYQTLLPILQTDDNGTMVNARDLHSQLGVRKKFADWFKEKISGYGFEEGVDFSISQKGEKPNKVGGRPSIEYNLTLSTAKELAMVQNNDAGRIARKYFIAIENAYKNRDEWNFDRADSLNCGQIDNSCYPSNQTDSCVTTILGGA